MQAMRFRSFDELRAELQRRGYFEKPTGRILLELTFHVVMFATGLAIVVAAESWLVKAVGMLVNVTGALGIATNTHTSAHFATSDRRWANVALVYFGYPLIGQFSVTYWWKKHNYGHHRVPNVVGHDNDVDFMPFFTYSRRDAEGSGRLRRLYYRYQGLVLPFALLTNGLNVQTYDWRHLWSILRKPEKRRPLHWLDAAALIAHWILWIVIPAQFFPLTDVIAFNVVHRALLGICIFIFFAPAHHPVEAIAVDECALEADPLLLQTATVVNFRTGPFGRLMCAGVDYQIEHHLFPNVAHVHYPAISRLVEAFCREHGYPYRRLGWGEAIWKAYLNFWRPKPVAARLEDYRLVSGRERHMDSIPAPHPEGCAQRV